MFRFSQFLWPRSSRPASYMYRMQKKDFPLHYFCTKTVMGIKLFMPVLPAWPVFSRYQDDGHDRQGESIGDVRHVISIADDRCPSHSMAACVRCPIGYVNLFGLFFNAFPCKGCQSCQGCLQFAKTIKIALSIMNRILFKNVQMYGNHGNYRRKCFKYAVFRGCLSGCQGRKTSSMATLPVTKTVVRSRHLQV